jgi:hypothetical protein
MKKKIISKKNKKKQYDITLNMNFVIDNLKFGWMCPLCEKIYSPYVNECPGEHKMSSNRTSTWTRTEKKEK